MAGERTIADCSTIERVEKVYKVGDRNKKSILEMESTEFERIWRVLCLGGMIVGRERAQRTVARGQGIILFTGGRCSRRVLAGCELRARLNILSDRFGEDRPAAPGRKRTLSIAFHSCCLIRSAFASPVVDPLVAAQVVVKSKPAGGASVTQKGPARWRRPLCVQDDR